MSTGSGPGPGLGQAIIELVLRIGISMFCINDAIKELVCSCQRTLNTT